MISKLWSDRIIVRHESDELATRLADLFETALNLADGLVFADDAKTEKRTVFSARSACPVSGFTIDEVEPRLFSFNNPFGACPSCDGLGTESHFDAELIVPDKQASLRSGALAPWANSSSKYYMQTLESLARHFQFSLDVPFTKLDAKVQNVILMGSGRESVVMQYDDGLRSYRTQKPFEGIIPNLTRRYRETDSAGCAKSWINSEPIIRARLVTARD